MRPKQNIKKVVWYIGEKKENKKVELYPYDYLHLLVRLF